MGAFLDKPVTAKESEAGGERGGALRWGASAMQGWRKGMEDEHIAILPSRAGGGGAAGGGPATFGVFDGHGGREVATFCKRYLGPALAVDPRFGSCAERGPGPTAQLLISSFHLMDDMMRQPEYASELEGYRDNGPPAVLPPPAADARPQLAVAGEGRFGELAAAVAARRAG
eukprot:SAG22_NODE_1902_length_3339_cov_2.045370_7_plen_171_part_01